MHANPIRITKVIALLLFVTYLYSPCEVTFYYMSTDRSVQTGMEEILFAFDFTILRIMMEPGLDRWQSLKLLWDDAACEVHIVAGSIAMSQLPLLTSPQIRLRRPVIWLVSGLFFACAAAFVYKRLNFIWMQSSSGLDPNQAPGFLGFGAWLAPAAFAFAGIATILRRNEAAQQ